MSCCLSCAETGGSCGTLGQYPALPGHSVPYALTDAEIFLFLQKNSSHSNLQDYVRVSGESGESVPSYGVIVNESYGQFLVWYDGSMRLHVTDVTNMNIANEVQKAEFESPDSGFIENLVDQIKIVVGRTEHVAEGVAVTAGVVALAYLLWRVAR